jgi:hypothetical protein
MAKSLLNPVTTHARAQTFLKSAARAEATCNWKRGCALSFYSRNLRVLKSETGCVSLVDFANKSGLNIRSIKALIRQTECMLTLGYKPEDFKVGWRPQVAAKLSRLRSLSTVNDAQIRRALNKAIKDSADVWGAVKALMAKYPPITVTKKAGKQPLVKFRQHLTGAENCCLSATSHFTPSQQKALACVEAKWGDSMPHILATLREIVCR